MPPEVCCRPMRISLPIAMVAAISGLSLPSCETARSTSSGRPYVPTVAFNGDHRFTETENRFLGSVEDVLSDAGYRVTRDDRRADYVADLIIDQGPINTDTTITLARGDHEVARAEARVGSATTLFRRGKVAEQSFEKALAEFQNEVPPGSRPRGAGGRGSYGSDDDYGSSSGGRSGFRGSDSRSGESRWGSSTRENTYDSEYDFDESGRR